MHVLRFEVIEVTVDRYLEFRHELMRLLLDAGEVFFVGRQVPRFAGSVRSDGFGPELIDIAL